MGTPQGKEQGQGQGQGEGEKERGLRGLGGGAEQGAGGGLGTKRMKLGGLRDAPGAPRSQWESQCVAAANSIVAMGLEGVWDLKPLLNGKEVISVPETWKGDQGDRGVGGEGDGVAAGAPPGYTGGVPGLACGSQET